MEITPKILKKLTQKKYRREFSLCILLGEKIIADNTDKIVRVFDQNELPKELLNEIVGLENYSGQIAVAKIPAPTEPTMPFLVLDNIQDAGNMGAIFRSAAAFGFRTVYCIACVDPSSPKVIRASSGMSLQLNVIDCDYAELPANGFLYVADMNGKDLQTIKPAKPADNAANTPDGNATAGRTADTTDGNAIAANRTADAPGNATAADNAANTPDDNATADRNFGIVLGNEGRGVSPEIYKRIYDRPHTVVSIPMLPACESLNVAVAGGIIMYCLYAK